MVADDRIKSAREIAMEKVAGMPGLTPEELRQQREREFAPRGEAIATRYLAGALRETDLQTELGKYRDEEARIVRRAFLSVLCRSVSLDDAGQSQRALEGVRASGVDMDLERVKEEFAGISRAFRQAQDETFEGLEEGQRKMLRGLGISGPAVRPNVRAGKDVQHELVQIRQPYETRLNELKERLLGCAG